MKHFDFDSFARYCKDFIAVLDLNFQFVEVNKVWCDFLHLQEDELINTDVLKRIFHEDVEGFISMMNRMRIGEFKSSQYLRLLGSGNNFIYTQFSVRKTKRGYEVLLRDISKETEDAMVVQKAAQLADLGAWSHDPVANKSYWNKVVYRIYDLEEDSPMDHETVVSLYHPEDKERMTSVIEKLYSTNTGYDEITRIITPKNNHKWIRVVAEPIVNDGEILWISGFAQDVTQRQEVLEKMRQSEEQKYLALKGVKSGVFDYDLVKKEIHFSEDFGRMLGLDHRYPVSDFVEFMHPEDREGAMHRFINGLAAPGNHFENQYRLRDVKGVYRHYEVHAWRKKNEEGKTTRMVGNLMDVDQRVKAQIDRSNYLAQLEAVLNNGFVKSVLLDSAGRVLMADAETRKIGILEYGSDAVEGNIYFGDILPADERKRFEAELPKVLAGQTVRKEVQHVYSDGSIGWLEVIYNPVKSADGKVSGLVISFMDIASKKMTEIERRYHQSRLDEVNRMKGNIISNLSHEVRTPLNGIMNVAELLPELLPEMVVKSEVRELLEIQRKSANRLLKTIDGIVSLSKFEAEKNTLNVESLDVSELLRQCYDKLAGQVKRKGLLFELKNCEPETMVMADRIMLEQSLINVMNNAVKFTEEGAILVKCSSNSDFIKIMVQDTGIGISLENQERIFADFEQESLGHSRAYEGTGVGLSFTKKFLELMGGQIDLVSIKGEGSIFTIILPVLK